MTTNHIKAILTSLRAMVMKMLPAYKFYLGSTTTTTQIGHGVMSGEDGKPYGVGYLTLDDASFSGFVVGDIFTVSINGVSGEYTATNASADGIVIADFDDDEENGWLIGYESSPSRLVYVVEGTYVNATISISKTKTVKNYQTKKLSSELLPDSVESELQEIRAAYARKNNPVFTGHFSQNRAVGSVVGAYSHAEGSGNQATGLSSHAEGGGTQATGDCSHAEGSSTAATADNSHAEGSITTAGGYNSHAEGFYAMANGMGSHVEGYSTTASGDYQHVQGRQNVVDQSGKYAHIVGNGTDSAKSNAHTLDWNGVPWYQGRPQFGGTAQDNGAQTVVGNGDKEIILASGTSGSTKKFKLTVDDSGTLSATEVTDA